MEKILFIVSLFFIFTSTVLAGVSEEDNCKDKISFRTVDISVDSKTNSLAAYQIDIRYDKENIKVVGLEGGTDGFNNPPFYDREGLEGGRIIIAAFIDDDMHAKNGKTRVARLHLQTKGCRPNELKTKLMAAARPGGKEIPVDIEVSFIDDQSVNNR
jgi:hypothetical protein